MQPLRWCNCFVGETAALVQLLVLVLVLVLALCMGVGAVQVRASSLRAAPVTAGEVRALERGLAQAQCQCQSESAGTGMGAGGAQAAPATHEAVQAALRQQLQREVGTVLGLANSRAHTHFVQGDTTMLTATWPIPVMSMPPPPAAAAASSHPGGTSTSGGDGSSKRGTRKVGVLSFNEFRIRQQHPAVFVVRGFEVYGELVAL